MGFVFQEVRYADVFPLTGGEMGGAVLSACFKQEGGEAEKIVPSHCIYSPGIDGVSEEELAKARRALKQAATPKPAPRP